MQTVEIICQCTDPIEGLTVRLQATLLLGVGFRKQYVADSVEGFDRGIALPLADDLFERLFKARVWPIGGGRFSLRYGVTVEGQIVLNAESTHKYALANVVLMIVRVDESNVMVFQPRDYRDSAVKDPALVK